MSASIAATGRYKHGAPALAHPPVSRLDVVKDELIRMGLSPDFSQIGTSIVVRHLDVLYTRSIITFERHGEDDAT
jgi:hypothetical protein